jgi:phosphatidylinositol alpha-mannosyltransferase
MPHKNLGLLIAALWHLREAGQDVRLVVVGPETQGIRARVSCPLYGDRVEPDEDWHMLGLGLVSNDDLLDLMQEALVVVNPSLCEAGSGSGLDAWGCGAPVAVSDIPAFRDQVRYLGTKAAFFDPRDPRDAARVLLGMIRDPEGRAADAAASQAAIGRYDWSEVARRYLAVFEALQGSPLRAS